jgi:hypothetical protein
MALHLRDVNGDRSETHANVLALLHAAYDDALGIHEISLHYTTGRGYRVLNATRRALAGGAYKPGDKFAQAQPVDIAAEIKARLRDAGVQVHE